MGIKIDLYQHQNNLLIESFDDIIIKILHKSKTMKMKTLLFCGSEPGVGTTTIAINMAVSLAQSKNKTLLIDSDMRKSAKSKRLSQTQILGLSDYLSGKATIPEITSQTNFDNLDYISCGTSSDEASKLLRFNNLDKLILSLAKSYEFILFDSPSLDVVNDAAALSILVDGILIVSELGRTTKSNIGKTVQHFSEAREKILGILINKVEKPEYRMYMRNYDYFQKGRSGLNE